MIATLVACEIIVRLPFNKALLQISNYTIKATSVLSSERISDNWKEKVLPLYARKICNASLMIFVFILACLSPFAIIGLLAADELSRLFDSLASIKVSFSITLIAIVYIFFRRKLM